MGEGGVDNEVRQIMLLLQLVPVDRWGMGKWTMRWEICCCCSWYRQVEGTVDYKVRQIMLLLQLVQARGVGWTTR